MSIKAGLMHTIHAGTEIAGLRTMMAFEIGERSTRSPGGLQENRGMQTGTEAAGLQAAWTAVCGDRPHGQLPAQVLKRDRTGLESCLTR